MVSVLKERGGVRSVPMLHVVLGLWTRGEEGGGGSDPWLGGEGAPPIGVDSSTCTFSHALGLFLSLSLIKASSKVVHGRREGASDRGEPGSGMGGGKGSRSRSISDGKYGFKKNKKYVSRIFQPRLPFGRRLDDEGSTKKGVRAGGVFFAAACKVEGA